MVEGAAGKRSVARRIMEVFLCCLPDGGSEGLKLRKWILCEGYDVEEDLMESSPPSINKLCASGANRAKLVWTAGSPSVGLSGYLGMSMQSAQSPSRPRC